MPYIGLDIGGTKCAAVLGRAEGNAILVEARRAFSTPGDWRAALSELFRASRELLSGQRPDAIGLSCGGPLDAESGVILSPPNLIGWNAVPVVRLAREALGAPAFLENDANACALAEWRMGAGRGCKHMAFLTFGTGMGAGLILNGRLFRGAGGDAGEIGHIRLSPFGPAGYGKIGSFEGFCSGGGIAQIAETLGRERMQRGLGAPGYPVPGASAKDAARAARAGDECALSVFRLCGEKLGEGLAALIDILNPERIVIGSVFARCRDLLAPSMLLALERETLPRALSAAHIVPAELGDSIGDMAALCVAENGLRESGCQNRALGL